MSKKKKILVASICAIVLALGAILTVVLINIKRFSTYTTSVINYNNHTQMTSAGYGSTYHANTDARLYENGTQIIEDNENKLGLYSYIEKRTLIEPSYDSVEAIEVAESYGKSYFLLKNNDQPNNLKIVDERGENLGLTAYDTNNQKSYTYIKTKSVVTNEKKGKISTKEGKFENKKIYISSVSFEGRYTGEKYSYETWKFETEDGDEFTNIYDTNNDRQLVQTMGVKTGNSFGQTNLTLYVLENGDIRFLEITQDFNDTQYKTTSFAIYDQNYQLKGRNLIDLNKVNTIVSVGDKILIQLKEFGSEDDYTYKTSSSAGMEYYKLTTYTIDFKTGKQKTRNFNYVLNSDEDKHSVLNQNTSILDVQKIKDKKLSDNTYLLINNRLQTREIDYSIKTFSKIADNRFIAKTTNTVNNNYVLINDKFELICNFNDISSYFTTNESVVLTSGQKAYVCDLDGLVLKTYDKDDIINIHHKTYYMIKEESIEGGKVKTEYYLERLGVRANTPISSHIGGEDKYYSNGLAYTEVKLIYSLSGKEVVSLVMTINKVSETNYTYQIFNFDGDLLLSINSIPNGNKTLQLKNSSSGNYTYSNNYVLVTLDGVEYLLDR